MVSIKSVPPNTVVSFATPNPAGDTAISTAQHAEYAVLLVDLHGQIQFASPTVAALLKLTGATTLIGRPIISLIPSLTFTPSDIDTNLGYLNGWSHSAEWQRIKANGLTLEARINRAEIAAQSLLVVELRTSEKHQAQLQLQSFIQSLVDAEEMLVVTDTLGKIVYVNPAFVTVSGFSLDEVMSQTLEEVLAWEKYPPQYAQMWSELGAGKSYHGIFLNRKKDQRLFHEERYARPFVNLEGRITHYIFTGRDVSDREKLIQRLEHIANHDELTELPNRHLFLDRLHQAQAHAARWSKGFALLLVDLDHFKAINDQYGHDAGDAVLVAVANRLSNCVREEDTVARLGGDEFAIILTDTDTHGDVLQLLDKIVTTLRKPILFNGIKLPTHASIGVAFYPLDTLQPDMLFKQADVAMYNAKAAGGNGYYLHHRRADYADADATSGQYVALNQQILARFTTSASKDGKVMTQENQ